MSLGQRCVPSRGKCQNIFYAHASHRCFPDYCTYFRWLYFWYFWLGGYFYQPSYHRPVYLASHVFLASRRQSTQHRTIFIAQTDNQRVPCSSKSAAVLYVCNCRLTSCFGTVLLHRRFSLSFYGGL